MAQSFSISPALPADMEEALGLIFHHLQPDDRNRRVANALQLIARGELDPRGITICRTRSRLLGAMATILLPGASGLVWPPSAVPHRSRRSIEDRLIKHSRLWLEGQGAKMAQAISPPAEQPLVEPLLRNGFKHMTTLWYLRHGLDPAGVAGESSHLVETAQSAAFLRYSSVPHDLFQETLERTYVGTLDCPELNGVRDLAEVMQGHREQAHADVGLWWLMALGDRPAGVLMLTPVPEWNALDISYLGVVPECRGRGLGRVLTAKALGEARKAGVTQLTLAVDSRNGPAWKTYIDLGFEAQEPRDVYLAVWGRN